MRSAGHASKKWCNLAGSTRPSVRHRPHARQTVPSTPHRVRQRLTPSPAKSAPQKAARERTPGRHAGGRPHGVRTHVGRAGSVRRILGGFSVRAGRAELGESRPAPAASSNGSAHAPRPKPGELQAPHCPLLSPKSRVSGPKRRIENTRAGPPSSGPGGGRGPSGPTERRSEGVSW